MKRIPQHIVDQVIQESNIADVLSEYIPLKKAGANFKTNCPFHQEKTASFMVSPDKQIFHCFGCGEGGNVASFIMKYERIEFPQAIERLAERLNITIEKQNTQINENEFDQLYKVNTYANWFFTNSFENNKEGQEYTKSRAINEDTVKKYELGYAPDGFGNLVKFLSEKKIPLELAQRLGLIKKRDTSGHYDFFRGRLTFPIHNSRGKIVGFGARTLSNANEAKYLNSSESLIYNKSKELYGLFQAKKAIIQRRQAIVVEGNIDVLAAYQLDIPNVVAPLGTSLTANQVKILTRYCSDILLMFDGDSAGLQAAKKAIATCFEAGIHPKIVILPQNQDPGDYLTQKEGESDLKQALEKAVFAMDWLFASYIKKVTHETGSRAKIIKVLADWLKRLPDAVEKMEYRKKLAQYFDISPDDIEKIVEITYKSDKLPRQSAGEPSLEAILIWLYINDPEQFLDKKISQYSENFSDNDLRRLAAIIEKHVKKHETFHAAQAIQEIPEDLSGVFSRITFLNNWVDKSFDSKSCIQKFQNLQNKKRLKEITARILEAETKQNTDLKLTLLKEKQELLAALKTTRTL